MRDYRRSGNHPYWEDRGRPGRKRRWTPAEVVDLLVQHPEHHIDMGIWNGRPVGHENHREVGRVVNEAQAIARSRGVDTSRLAFHFRPDVFGKHMPGQSACGDACGWNGTMAEPVFDPGFIMKVPRSEHAWSIANRWGNDPRKDPFRPGSDSAAAWPRWMDRQAMTAPNTADEVVALYGAPFDSDPAKLRQDWAFRVSGVVMDLRNPAYRAWSVARLVATLKAMGIDRGESATILFSYKPGWHAYYDGGPAARQSCYVAGGRAWTGPAGPCAGPGRYEGGLFHRTGYGPGEFRDALNDLFREMRAGLVAAGYPDVSVVTTERPNFGGRAWLLLAADVRAAPWLLGELGGTCYRRDATARPDPVRCR